MNIGQVETEINDILATYIKTKESNSSNQINFVDNEEMDSFALLNFITELEEHFNIEITEDDLADTKSHTLIGISYLIKKKISR